ncbi:rhomboid family intramembrane serine protease [Thalassoroseus pseudoceratinae]|uniref:rhomboid family intramembrane serine protease n=1 Tax=Thalassoroseus pseudoceratinae TaxID=2713176 RepID=UPI001422D78F|nr:rhomboid family intramembrane serine protease [Thalassoroseus pseudoceratinae]
MTHPQPRTDSHTPGWRVCPLTTLVIGIVVIAHAVVLTLRTGQNLSMPDALQSSGAVVWQSDSTYAELQGPFDLWQGEWWRVPLTTLHHASVWQLVVNVLAFIYLGRLIEPKVDRKTYAFLIVLALFALPLPRLLLQSTWETWLLKRNTFGLSGVVFALFGFAIAMRSQRSELARSISPQVIMVFLVALSAGLVFVSPKRWPVDNLSHICGILLGWSVGFGVATGLRNRFRQIVVLGLSGVTIYAATAAVLHPVWNGRYQWWLAENNSDPSTRLEHIELATKRAPQFAWPWYLLAEQKLDDGQPMEAWQTILEGYRHNKNFAKTTELSHRIWNQFQTSSDRESALQELRKQLPTLDLTRQALIPGVSLAEHYAATEQPLQAWHSLLGHLEQSTAKPEKTDTIERLARNAWSQLKDPTHRQAVLHSMALRMRKQRREWQKKLIPNRDLITYYREAGELLWAWECIIDELRRTPESQELLSAAQDVWSELPTDTRRHRARRIVEKTFGRDASLWKWRLGILKEEALHSMRLNQPIVLPLEFLGENRLQQDGTPRPQELSAPAIDADSPESAIAGQTI